MAPPISRGQSEIGNRAFVPYYVDVGSGSSNLTWQAFAGLGYHFTWGDATVGYRYLAYDFRGDSPLSKLTFGGPIAGVGLNF